MGKGKVLTAPEATKKMPRAVPYILTNEFSERFSFYGTRCILVIFMTKYLLGEGGALATMTEGKAKEIFHLFVSATYFTTVFGSLISDIWLGKYKTIVLFAIVNCIGCFMLAFDQTRMGLYWGMILIALGSGMIKPCVSANVGDQFGKTNQHLVSRMYQWFYFSINVGSTISIFLCPILLDKFGPRYAFGLPAVFMAIATLAYVFGYRAFVHIPAGGWGFVKETFSGEGLRTLLKLAFMIFIFVSAFWAIFDQMDSAWVLQAEKLNRNVSLGFWEFEVLPSQLAVVNPIFIILFIPLFSFVVYPAMNKVFRLTPLRKMTIGMFWAAVPFTISALVEIQLQEGSQPSILWMILAHATLAAGEIMVSITVLEFAYTQAPKKMKSFIQAVSLLAISAGNFITAIINKVIQNPDGTSKLEGPSYFWFFVWMMLGTAVVFMFMAMLYKEKMYLQDEGAS